MTRLILFCVFFAVATSQDHCPPGRFFDASCTLLDIHCVGLCRNETHPPGANIKPPLFEGDISLHPKVKLGIANSEDDCPPERFFDASCTLLDVHCKGLCRNGTKPPSVDIKPPLFEGDILINIQEKIPKNALLNKDFLWSNKIIPIVTFGYSYDEYQIILQGLRTLEEYTCLKFVNRTNHEDYIEVYRGSGCFSAVGKVGGKQYLSLGYGCLYVGTVMHEFMHALGFYHEQSRNDRDNYVYIALENVYPGMEYNFDKYPSDFITSLNQRYDYASLMHYTKDAFSKNGKDTIFPKQAGVTLIHSAYKYVPSEIDAKKINILYDCAAKPLPTTTVVTTKKTLPCLDRLPYCTSWATAGYCNSLFVKAGCPGSCNVCFQYSLYADFSENCSYLTCGTEYVDVVCKKKCTNC